LQPVFRGACVDGETAPGPVARVELLGNHPIAVREFWMFLGQSEENIASNVLTDRLKCLLVLVCCRRRAIPPRGR